AELMSLSMRARSALLTIVVLRDTAPEDRLRINLDVLAMICRLGAKTFPIVLRELSEQGHGCIDPNGAYRFWGISVMPTPIPNCAAPDPGWIYAFGDQSTRLIKIGK